MTSEEFEWIEVEGEVLPMTEDEKREWLSDVEYSPAYQDEYRRLWHEARGTIRLASEALAPFLATSTETGVTYPDVERAAQILRG